MQRCNVLTLGKIWRYNSFVKIIAQKVTGCISIFYDNSSRNIITPRSFLYCVCYVLFQETQSSRSSPGSFFPKLQVFWKISLYSYDFATLSLEGLWYGEYQIKMFVKFGNLLDLIGHTLWPSTSHQNSCLS